MLGVQIASYHFGVCVCLGLPLDVCVSFCVCMSVSGCVCLFTSACVGALSATRSWWVLVGERTLHSPTSPPEGFREICAYVWVCVHVYIISYISVCIVFSDAAPRVG